MRRYSVLIAAVIVNLCLGGIYAWSVFVPELKQDYGYTTAQTQLVFGTVICVMIVTMLFGGRLESRFGPKPLLFACAALMLCAYGFASFANSNFALLWVCYGLLGGIGTGLGYVTVLASGIKWLPNRRGFACGLIIAGFGGGAIMLSMIAQRLLSLGWNSMEIFRCIGIVFAVILSVCAVVISNPAGYKLIKHDFTIRYRDLFGSLHYWAMAFVAGYATLPGLMIIGNLKPIALSFGHLNSIAGYSIVALSVGSISGRMIVGYFHDKLKTLMVKIVLLMVTATTLILMSGVTPYSYWFMFAAFLAGLSYGGALSVTPAQIASEYGQNNFGMVYPAVIVVFGLFAPFGATLAGYIYDRYDTYQPALILAATLCFLCFLFFCFAYRKGNDPVIAD